MPKKIIYAEDAIDALGEKPLVWDDLSDFDLGKAAQWSDDVDAIKALPSAQPQRWIPVTERLPEEDLCTGYGRQYSESVLMTAHNTIDDEDIVDYGHTVDGRWFSDTTDAYIPDNWDVTAWQKLPEPYKGEQ